MIDIVELLLRYFPWGGTVAALIVMRYFWRELERARRAHEQTIREFHERLNKLEPQAEPAPSEPTPRKLEPPTQTNLTAIGGPTVPVAFPVHTSEIKRN